jgi:hypothetical protein
MTLGGVMRLVVFAAIITIIGNAMALGQSLQQQEICAKQAKAYFQEYSADDQKLSNAGYKPLNNDYQSHYNVKLNKCLILVETSAQEGQEFHTSIQLVDAFERRIFATYGWTSRPGKKYWEVPPTLCELAPTSHETTNCSSREEFDALVSKYMEEQ